MDEEQCEVQRKTAALVYLPMPLLSSSKDLNAGIIIFSAQIASVSWTPAR